MTAVTIVHQIPGRIRLRIVDKRRDAAFFDRLSEQLSGIDAVHGLRANPVTGSVVVRHEGEAGALLQKMQERIPGLIIERERPAVHVHPLGSRRVRLVSGRQLSPMFMAGTALATVGLVQTFRRRITVPSITAFWYAIEAFRQAKKRGNGTP